MLAKRIVTALILLPLVVAAVWFDEPLPWLTVFVAIFGGLAILEFFRIVARQKVRPLVLLGFVWTILFIVSPHLDLTIFSTPALLTSLIFFSLIWLVLRRNKEAAFTAWAWTVAGVLYVGLLLSHLVLLRDLDFGREWVLFALFATFASDTSAYFIGRRWGRDLLAPDISPGKTWQGAVAGVVAAIVMGLVLLNLFNLPLSYGQVVVLALAVSVFGQLGDLVESLFKRNMNTKDSGDAIPGHGGFLDRLDSVIFAGIVVYYFVIWFVQ
jgi:phosphatidate cytidylyltransferase